MSLLQIRRLPAADLGERVADAATTSLILDRIPRVSGWEALSRLPALRKISVVVCGSEEAWRGDHSLALDVLYASSSTSNCLRCVVSLCDAEEVTVLHEDARALDLAMFTGHEPRVAGGLRR